MAIKGVTWNEEFRKEYFSKEKVQANLKNFIEMAKQPKSAETKQKMSIAKSGRKYTEEHKHNMAEAQRFRHALHKDIAIQQPELTKSEVWAKVSEKLYD